MSPTKKVSRKQGKGNEKDIRRFENAPWILLFTVAVTKDVIDPIPVITILVDFFTAPYFLYFLLRYTKKEERILGFAITGLEMIPFVGILPMTTGSFFIIYKIMEKKHDQANAKE